MKKSVLTAALFCNIILSCSSQNNSSSSSTTSYDNGKKGKSTFTMTDGKTSLKIELSGEIIFTEDETGIQSISKDGFLKYKKGAKKFTATNDGKGGIAYEIYEGQKQWGINNQEAKDIIGEAIRLMIEHGVDAKNRVVRIYKKGGSQAVLSEVGNMKSDYVRGIYLGYLLESNNLSADEMTAIAGKINTLLSSDYEKGKLLGEFSTLYLKNPQTAMAYLDAVKSIESDYEKANAMKNILQQPLSNGLLSQALVVVTDIGSDYEKAGVLEEVLDKNVLSAEQFSLVLKAVAAISSDYEKAGVLEKILNNSDIPAAQYKELLSVIGSIDSDYEKANVLEGLTGKKNQTDEEWITLISMASKISSDYEKGNVLVKIANNMPGNDKIKTAYMVAAKTVSSDYEYAKVVRAVN